MFTEEKGKGDQLGKVHVLDRNLNSLDDQVARSVAQGHMPEALKTIENSMRGLSKDSPDFYRAKDAFTRALNESMPGRAPMTIDMVNGKLIAFDRNYQKLQPEVARPAAACVQKPLEAKPVEAVKPVEAPKPAEIDPRVQITSAIHDGKYKDAFAKAEAVLSAPGGWEKQRKPVTDAINAELAKKDPPVGPVELFMPIGADNKPHLKVFAQGTNRELDPATLKVPDHRTAEQQAAAAQYWKDHKLDESKATNPDGGKTLVVQPGDNIWTIAAHETAERQGRVTSNTNRDDMRNVLKLTNDTADDNDIEITSDGKALIIPQHPIHIPAER
jgi:hypothetical protein